MFYLASDFIIYTIDIFRYELFLSYPSEAGEELETSRAPWEGVDIWDFSAGAPLSASLHYRLSSN